MNPLLDFTDLPRFGDIRPEHIAPAMTQLLAQAQQALQEVTRNDFPISWTAISARLDVATEQLGRAWGAVGHLHSVADTPELRAAYTAMLPQVTEFYTQLGSDERLYAKYKAMDPTTLNAEQKQALRNSLRHFVLSGAELVGAAKERFAQIQERLAELSQQFSEHVLDCTDRWSLRVDAQCLDGVPDDVRQVSAAAAQEAASLRSNNARWE